MTVVITRKIELQLPNVPNFILASNGKDKFAIGDLDEKALREIGRLWTEALIEKFYLPKLCSADHDNQRGQNER